MKTDPYSHGKKMQSMILVSNDMRHMRIFMGSPRGEGVKRQWGCRRRQIQRFRWLFVREL